MAPSNTTRPRTGSLSLRHSSTIRNYYGNNTATARNNSSAANNNYGSSGNNHGGPKTTSSGIERSYNSITDNLKGKLSSIDASLDSRGSLNGSAGLLNVGAMKSGSRSSMNNSRSSMNNSRSSLNSRRNSTGSSTNETTLQYASSQSQTTSSTYYQEGRYQDGVVSIPSFASTSTSGVISNTRGGVESIQSTNTLGKKTDSQRRSSLREIKAALRAEKLQGALSFDDTVTTTTSDSVRQMLRGGGMESIVPSFEESLLESVQEGGRMESSVGGDVVTYNSDERCQLDELWNDPTNHQHGGRQLDTVQEAAAAVGGRMSNGPAVIVNQRSCESLDTFRKDTSTINNSSNKSKPFTNNSSTTTNNSRIANNNNNTYKSSRGSAGLYSANLTSKKTPSKAVSKMSQASFGKIRDILSGGEGAAGNSTAAAAGRSSGAHHASTNNNHGGNNATTLMGGYRESGIGLGGILQFGRNNSADEEMSFFVSDNDGKVHKEHHLGAGNTAIGGKRDSGLGGILQFGGRTNSADEEMSFFVSDDNGKVHKEKVPLVNKEEDGEKKKKVLLLEQDKFQLGETMKVTNVSRGGAGEKKTKPTVSFQQQQQRSVFHTKRQDETKMSTAPQSPIHDPSSGHTPPIVRSVKKATRAVSHSMKHEVVPATKAMAALTAKFVERGEKKMVDNVAPKLRAVALDIDSRLHPRQQQSGDGGFVGLQHIEGKGDYVCDPDYHVVPTPQHVDQIGRRAYGPNAVHNFDPNTPACLLGALTAGTMFNYDITHPEHPEYLPEGMPRELDVPGDWEERAGFVPAATLVVKKRVGPVDLDEEIEGDDESVRVEEMLALQQAVAMSHQVDQVAEEEAEEEVTDEEDARNASMWVAYNPEEDMEEEDEIMNVGEIIIATGGELCGEDNEFSPRSVETSDSNTYHVGDLSLGIKSDDAHEQKETAIVTFQQDQEVQVEIFEDDNGENEDEAGNYHPVEEHYAATPMKKVTYENGETPSQQQQFTDKKKEFQTPFSVKKGERPLTFDEFRAMNRRVLFDNEEQAQPTQAMVNVDIGRNTEIEEQPQHQMTVEKFVSASSRYEQSGHSQRELKGRVVMIRIKKKISKTVKKALKSILLTAKIGGKKKCSNNSISETNFVITIPSVEASGVPDSPSAVSIASSLLSAAINGSSKRVIGAAPFSSNINAAPDHLYGAVNYHNRTDDGSVDESEQLPPPPRMTPNQASDHDDEDVVSFLAEAMNQGMNIDMNIEEVLATDDGKEVVDEEEQMYLVLTPSEGGEEKVTQIISGKVDGTPVIFNEIMLKNEEGSEIKPHNLSIMFESGKKESNNKSIQIMDAVKAGGNIVLTPSESNQNVSNVFRRTSTGEASASVLQSSSEDETLVTHDGNTLVRLDTKDSHDHTITTTTSLRKEEENKPLSTFELVQEDDPKDAGKSPPRPAYSRQAASNASFLFSPNNMGRADPSIRAKERAMMRNQSHGGSITMLPSASSIDKSEQQLVLKPKPSYSFDSASGDVKYDTAPSIASMASIEEPDTPSTVATAVQKKPVMASMTKDRQFSFKTILNQFSTDALDSNDQVPRVIEQKHFLSPEQDFGSSESQSKTPLVTNAVRKKYAGAPFTKAERSTPSKPMSPSSSPISSKSRRKSSPKGKTLPKSAAKTRTGLVKDRISMFQQRVDAPSAVTGVNGRLKRNHSYRFKNERRETNGGGALAPRKAVLKSAAFIRTVPIGISASYSRDDAGFGESMSKADAGVEQTYAYAQNDGFREDEDSIEKSNSYVKQYSNTSKVNEEAESFGRGSLDSSTCVSEATEFDAFNSLLGKFDDDDSSVESESSEETLVTEKQKENVSMSPNVLPSTSPFKQRVLVKPNEINHNRTPLTAQKWRTMAATHGKSSKKLVMKY